MSRFFKVTAGFMEDTDLCAKLDKLLNEKDFEVLSICVVNGTEVAYCVDLQDVWVNTSQPANILKLVPEVTETPKVEAKVKKPKKE